MRPNNRFDNATIRSMDAHDEAQRKAEQAEWERKHRKDVDAEFQRLMSADAAQVHEIRNAAMDAVKPFVEQLSALGYEVDLGNAILNRITTVVTTDCENAALFNVHERLNKDAA